MDFRDGSNQVVMTTSSTNNSSGSNNNSSEFGSMSGITTLIITTYRLSNLARRFKNYFLKNYDDLNEILAKNIFRRYNFRTPETHFLLNVFIVYLIKK